MSARGLAASNISLMYWLAGVLCAMASFRILSTSLSDNPGASAGEELGSMPSTFVAAAAPEMTEPGEVSFCDVPFSAREPASCDGVISAGRAE